VANGKKIDLYRQYHKNQALYPGNTLEEHSPLIANLIAQHDVETVLDYGCGKGYQYTKHMVHKQWGVIPVLYDPAVPEFDEKPIGTFDMVLCTDVLEHVPEDELGGILGEIRAYTEKLAFFSVCTRKAMAVLPNGENAHCTIKRQGWWIETIRSEFPDELVEIVFSR